MGKRSEPFTKDNIWMVNKNINILTLLIIWQMQTKTTRYQYTSIRVVKIKLNTKCWQKNQNSHIADGNVKLYHSLNGKEFDS